MEILVLIVLICTLSEEPVVEEKKEVVIEVPEEAVNVEEVHAIAEALKAIGNVRG